MKRGFLLAAAVCLAASGIASAQTGPGYDRKATFLLFPPDAAGGSSTRVVFEVLAPGGVGTGDDISTEAELRVNGVTSALKTWTLVGESGGWITWDPDHQPVPGDEIMILLRPAPGALPDPDPGNDTQVRTYDGTPSGWNRALTSVQVVPDGRGTATVYAHDRLVLSNIGASGDDGVDMSHELHIVDDFGTVLHVEPLPTQFDPPGPSKFQCTATCAAGSCGTLSGNPWMYLTASCLPSQVWFGNCGCEAQGTVIVPSIVLPPVGGVKVKLIPVPGALPELPGFEEDDEREPDTSTPADPIAAYGFGLTNYPNPFNPTTTLSLRLPVDGEADLTIYDARGQRVRTLHSGSLAAGTHQFVWEGVNDAGRPVASGVYYSQLRSADRSVRRRLALIK